MLKVENTIKNIKTHPVHLLDQMKDKGGLKFKFFGGFLH